MAHSVAFLRLLRALRLARRANLEAAGKPAPVPLTGVRLTRRGFLKVAAFGGAGLAFSSQLRPVVAAPRRDGTAPRIAVVGGGIAGLNAAYQLQQAGYAATVYEARGRLGGRIHSVTGAVGDGLVLDFGGSFINSDHADMLALAEGFGLTLFNRSEDAARFPFPTTAYLFEGRSIPEAEVAAALRPLAEQIAADSALLDEDFDANAPQFDAISVEQYLDRHQDKLPASFVRRLIENSIRTEYGVEPRESSAIQLLFLLPTVDGASVELLGSSDELFTVQGGSGRIIEELARALEGQVQTRKRLTRLEEDEGQYRLTFNKGERVEADYVILAIPFTVLRKVHLNVKLPKGLERFIQQAELGRNEKIFAGMRERAWRREGGFALDGWSDLGFAALWDATQRQSDRADGVLTLFTGGREVDDTEKRPVRLQGRRLVERLDGVLPGIEAAATDRYLRTRWGRSYFTRGGYTTFKPGQYLEFGEFLYIEGETAEDSQDVHVGNLVFAGEHLSDAFYGYMNGGAETGRLAAQVVTRLIAEAPAGSPAGRNSLAHPVAS